MTHCSDDELVLEYYGEASEASAHLATCAACAERAEMMARIMLGELVRRRVLTPAGAAWPATSSPGASVAF